MTMQEVNEGNNVIYEAAGEEANVIFGIVKKEEMNDYISYTVIATGFDSARQSGFGKASNSRKSPTFVLVRSRVVLLICLTIVLQIQMLIQLILMFLQF